MLAISGLNMMLLPAVRLQVSDYSYLYDYTVRLQLSVRLHCPITAICTITLSDYNCKECLVENNAGNAPITFAEIVMVMINNKISYVVDKYTYFLVISNPKCTLAFKLAPLSYYAVL